MPALKPEVEAEAPRYRARLRYAEGGREVTLDECAKQLGVTRERVRQIERKALLKARAYLVAKYGEQAAKELLPALLRQRHDVPVL